jgi:hypothetical protein
MGLQESKEYAMQWRDEYRQVSGHIYLDTDPGTHSNRDETCYFSCSILEIVLVT